MKKKKVAIALLAIVIVALGAVALYLRSAFSSSDDVLISNGVKPSGEIVVVSGKPTFYVEEVETRADEKEVSLGIFVANNPGVSSIGLSLKYDKDALKLIGYDVNESIGGESVPFNEEVKDPKIVWINGLENVEGDFKLVTLTFDVSNAKSGLNSVGLIYDEDDVFDLNENNVEFVIMEGGIVCE